MISKIRIDDLDENDVHLTLLDDTNADIGHLVVHPADLQEFCVAIHPLEIIWKVEIPKDWLYFETKITTELTPEEEKKRWKSNTLR